MRCVPFCFRFCGFTGRARHPATSGGHVFLFCVFTGIVFSVGPPGGGVIFLSYVFTGILFSIGPSGTPSFVARRKIGEKGVPRGCGPLNPRSNVLGHSDVLCANHLATVRLTRLSRLRRSAYPLASACCTAVELMALSQPPNFRPQIRLVILSVPTFSPHYEQYNRVRGNSAKHATDGPKSRKLHYGEYVGPTHVSPPNPRIKARFQRAALEPFGVSFFDIFLHAKKDIATGGRRSSRASSKNVKRKTQPPEVIG